MIVRAQARRPAGTAGVRPRASLTRPGVPAVTPAPETATPTAVRPDEPLGRTLARSVQGRAVLQRMITLGGFPVAQKSLEGSFNAAIQRHALNPTLPPGLAAKLKAAGAKADYSLDSKADTMRLVKDIGGTLPAPSSWSGALGPSQPSPSASSSKSIPKPQPLASPSPSPWPGLGPSVALPLPSSSPWSGGAVKAMFAGAGPEPVAEKPVVKKAAESDDDWEQAGPKQGPEKRTVRAWMEGAGFTLAQGGNTWRRDLTAKAVYQNLLSPLHVTINHADLGRKATAKVTGFTLRADCLKKWHVTVVGASIADNVHAYYEGDVYDAAKSDLGDDPTAKAEAKKLIEGIGA